MRIFTSAAGRFSFPDSVEISHAKAVRDAVLGQILVPQPGVPLIKTEDDALNFVRNQCSDVIAKTPFKVGL